MPNNTTWLVLHVLCCIAQIGLVVAAAAAFAASFSGDTGQDDNTTHTLLPWTAFAIVSCCLLLSSSFAIEMLCVYRPLRFCIANQMISSHSPEKY